MTEFVASNRLRVYLDEHGGLFWAGGSQNGEPKQKVTQAFREFFLAERDTQLGRWRSKEHPDWIAYGDNNRVTAINEINGFVSSMRPVDLGREHDDIDEAVAREFFAAYPEPKPWHDAKPGEVWVITIDSYMVDAPAVIEDSGLFRTRDGQGWTRNHEQITAGRRIWPEVSND